MTIHAYDENYLSKAQIALAQMLRYAVEDAGYDPDLFFKMFLESGIAEAFENGDARYTVGMSGVELADRVLFTAVGKHCTVPPVWSMEKSPVYWCGWALAYYQWHSAHTFRDIYTHIRPGEITAMYTPYHEMDILKFVEALDQKVPPVDTTTNLARLRRLTGMSQRALAYAAGLSPRMIQHYEQRLKDINKAQGTTLEKLSVVLHCDMTDLLEKPCARPLVPSSSRDLTASARRKDSEVRLLTQSVL